MKIVEYCVVNEHDFGGLIISVNCKIGEGWQPFGSLQVVAPVLGKDDVAPMYSQAMVKYSDNE